MTIDDIAIAQGVFVAPSGETKADYNARMKVQWEREAVAYASGASVGFACFHLADGCLLIAATFQ